ncbi:putative membrane protein [Halobacteriovorax marinus SJ]|uniref:Membrane protein n=1 Tax=Halobacteriovorax marinus (strain ATCC BAA-682 / DSM 15412 / SJ) TaxID=862908 RepID=E1WX46_HALMS|nr:SemiSWEET family transporter [Halobacteriovorax marinus]CBW25747.1 putative membrane protein [Halobacteriovorax marinus SJ]
MNYIDFSRYVVTFSSILLIIGLYHQVYKMFTTKSADDFSMLMILSLICCQVTWINYGIVLDEWPILLLSSIELPAGALAFYGYLKFRTKHVL